MYKNKVHETANQETEVYFKIKSFYLWKFIFNSK